MTVRTETTFDSLNSLVHSVNVKRMNEIQVGTDDSNPRSRVLHLGACVGQLCASLLANAPFDPIRICADKTYPATLAENHPFWSASNNQQKIEIARSMGIVFISLLLAAKTFDVDLRECILKKMILNAKKYPVELCKGKSGKYTAYSSQTGITKTKGQSTVHIDIESHMGEEKKNDGIGIGNLDTHSIKGITFFIRNFATDRQWTRYHTPRNICLALLGEVGELAELFQWEGDNDNGQNMSLDGWSEKNKDSVKQELADVCIYLLRLADVCGIDLGQAVIDIMSPR